MSNRSIKNFINALSKTNQEYKINSRINKLPSYLHMVLLGLLLSDGSLEKSTPNQYSSFKCNFWFKKFSLFVPFI